MEEGRKEERKGGRERGRKVEGEKEVHQIDEEVDDRQTNGLPGWCQREEPTCQCRRPRRLEFNPWIGEIPWGKAWQPTPVLLPGEAHGQRSLAGHSPQGHKESDTTEATSYTHTHRDG